MDNHEKIEILIKWHKLSKAFDAAFGPDAQKNIETLLSEVDDINLKSCPGQQFKREN